MTASNDRYVLPTSWVSADDVEFELIENLIGKKPQCDFQIVVRGELGQPLVIENAPFFFDGTPMPTRFWLVDRDLISKVSKIESVGGITKVQEEIDLLVIQSIHERHKSQRDELINPNYDGPKPSGGVGGTRKGVKCLHTHLANYLATKDDEVGEWVFERLDNYEQ